MPEFPHLPLRDALVGTFKFKQSPRSGNPRTLANRNNKAQHGALLDSRADSLLAVRKASLEQRAQAGLPELDANIVPLFLQVDPESFDIEALKGFGIEIIAEEEEGFVIGASVDGFKSLKAKIEQFVEGDKAKNTAMLWDIVQGHAWRVEHILSDDLRRKWQDIGDEEMLVVDISIACYLKEPEFKPRKEGESKERYEKRRARWEEKNTDYLSAKDDIAFARQDEVERFFEIYDAEITSDFVSDEDSFGFRVILPGKALKDFVLNYPYVFEVIEHSEIEVPMVIGDGYEEWDVEVLAPDENAPKVCVVDSGIMEGHRLLSPAIKSEQSRNYVPTPPDTTADMVPNGGHGTRVAGAVLFGNTIPRSGTYLPFCFLYNARVLDYENHLSPRLFPPELMTEVCDHHADAHVFNLSINNSVACRTTHMSQWASSLDRLSHEDAHLFVVSAGNLADESDLVHIPGIKNHRAAGRDYPVYLLEDASRIANPAQSLFSITVGSVCLAVYEDDDLKSFGEKDHISSFSRSGLGLWKSIKPELVEYGGDWVSEKRGGNLVFKEQTCPETVVSKGPGVARDAVGTSYAAPKVAHILARLVSLFPDQGTLFHKALLIQSARLPEYIVYSPTLEAIRHYGYGIPNIDRAVENSEKRITFTASEEIASGHANLYSVKVPAELRGPGQNFDILVEVSLCYTAKTRRTRRRINSYLSSWLSWQSAPMGQSLAAFKQEVLKNIETGYEPEDIDPFDLPNRISWVIDERSNWGTVRGINRQANANQKDWATVKSYNLPEEFSFAVVAHKGWEKNLEETIPYAFVVSFEVLNGEIPLYELMAQVNVEVDQETQISLF